jgi:iron complex transport system substrate-binding protein
VAKRLGLENGFDHDPQPHGFATVRLRELLELPREARLLMVANREDAGYEEVMESPLWQAAPIVEAGRVIHLPTDTWFFGGPLSARRLADRVAEALTRSAEHKAAAPSPDAP